MVNREKLFGVRQPETLLITRRSLVQIQLPQPFTEKSENCVQYMYGLRLFVLKALIEVLFGKVGIRTFNKSKKKNQII